MIKIAPGTDTYLAARNDDKILQAKAIDRLNEQSGLFILSASASDQAAYEMSRYSQGLLTYSLLKAIKQEPDILENNRFLDVSRWFNSAKRSVSELSKENGALQDPQLATTTNFNIGAVDEQVIQSIKLNQSIPIMGPANCQNSEEAISFDDLELSKYLNEQFQNISRSATGNQLIYAHATSDPKAWFIGGRYTVKDSIISAKITLRQNKISKQQFELTGSTTQLSDFSKNIAVNILNFIVSFKEP
ncbi:MAG: hypothetical protein EOO07_38655 [Chitinophagaceae bacterium]|nr:MAG: hypothetical protein EOO07_38655 [Chitinophagaceae bacterium]